jgi:C4-dicarboxylate transporter DctM subunit
MLMIYSLIVFLLLVFMGVPIYFSFGLTATFACIAGGFPLQIIAQRLMIGMDSFVLLAVPGFILAGEIMVQGGISKRIVDFSNAVVGHLKGAYHGDCFNEHDYWRDCGVSCCGNSGDCLYPRPLSREGEVSEGICCGVGRNSWAGWQYNSPSIPMVVYSLVSGLSLLDLFLAGYLPGVIIGFSLMGYCYLVCKKRGYGRATTRFPFGISSLLLRDLSLPS